jgi:hypothetical protein
MSKLDLFSGVTGVEIDIEQIGSGLHGGSVLGSGGSLRHGATSPFARRNKRPEREIFS